MFDACVRQDGLDRQTHHIPLRPFVLQCAIQRRDALRRVDTGRPAQRHPLNVQLFSRCWCVFAS